jgi:hypothetical protein
VTRAQTILVVGGGIVGVFAALRARQLRPSSRIMLVEQDDALGGLLRSDMHPNGLQFDRGTHVLSQTGNADIDDLLFDDLDPAHWHWFSGPHRDLCGLLLDGQVLEDSPFLPAPASLVEERLASGKPSAPIGDGSLAASLNAHHGEAIADAVFRKPIYNLYRCELEELDQFVAGQLPLSRVTSDTVPNWLARADDADYRALVAFPDQRALPAAFANPLSAMYPRRMGIGQLFKNLALKLDHAGVELHFQTRVSDLVVVEGQISTVKVASGDGGSTSIAGPLDVVWAVPPFQLPGLLGAAAPETQFKPGWRTVIVDFCARMNRKLGCYYYIDYGDNDCFRLTNYGALSEEASKREDAPFTLEIWWRGAEMSDAEAHRLVWQRFRSLGLVSGHDSISHVRLRKVPQAAILASTQNMAALEALASTVKTALPANLINIGLLSEPRLFFTNDMLRNAEAKISAGLS